MRSLTEWCRNQWDRALAGASAVVGALAVLLGWLGASDVTLASEQIPFLASGAVGGLYALGLAATLWLSADMRDEWQKLDEIHRSIQDLTRGDDPEPAQSTRARRDPDHGSGESPTAPGDNGARPSRSRPIRSKTTGRTS